MVKDLLIIGAGPTGLYAWKYANSLHLSGTIVEANYEIGGQANLAYPEKMIHNLPGIKEIKAKDFVNDLLEDANCLESKIRLKTNTSVLEIIKIKVDNDFENHFLVKFSNNVQKTYRAILVCEGLGEYQSIKLLEENWENIHYVVKDKKYFENKRVVIFGGGDSAIDWAHQFSEKSKVTLVHRRDEFRAAVQKIEGKVEILTPFEFKEIDKSENNRAKSLIIKSEEQEKRIHFDECLVQFGATIRPHTINGLNLQRNEFKKIIVNSEMESSCLGVFAAGDAVVYPTKKRNLIFGFQEVIIALSKIEMKINNKKIANKGW
ncbi:NAD(P)/FAD-dependent oxidoreductase [Spiroplasma endosymbiont of Panorpa germanica]|uniref:NAD(P)/FAD-dependent oxidoreductase n=1 Tax=Spiroplasma endosymbiont of Panorpa germanica TaxID=3066314 RepID=UPI0030CCA0E5